MSVEISGTLLLPDRYRTNSSAYMRINRFPTPSRLLIADPIIGPPSLDVAVEFFQASAQRLAPLARGQLFQSLVDPILGFL